MPAGDLSALPDAESARAVERRRQAVAAGDRGGAAGTRSSGRRWAARWPATAGSTRPPRMLLDAWRTRDRTDWPPWRDAAGRRHPGAQPGRAGPRRRVRRVLREAGRSPTPVERNGRRPRAPVVALPAHRRGPAPLPEAATSRRPRRCCAARSPLAELHPRPTCSCWRWCTSPTPNSARGDRAAARSRAGPGPRDRRRRAGQRRSRCGRLEEAETRIGRGRGPGGRPLGRARRGADRPRAVDPAGAAGLGDASARSAPRCSCRSTPSRPTTRASTASSASPPGRTPSPPRASSA